MKATRSYLLVASLVIGVLCLSNVVSLTGYFRALESGQGAGVTESRVLAQLQHLHQQLKLTEDPEAAKRQVRSFEGANGSVSGSGAIEGFRKTYAPVIAVFGSKPKESGERFLLVKKRELMETLVNAYRKEISGGRIPVRAAYLNILFDTQNSLLNESGESELVYLRRNKERFGQLKGLVGSDKALGFRVANLESIFQAYENGFEKAEQWRADLRTTLAESEKSLPKLAKSFIGNSSSQAEDARRFFLYSCIFALVASLLAYGVMFLAHKVMKMRFEGKIESLLRVIENFGRERSDPGLEKEFAALREDHDWGHFAQGVQESESRFVEEFQSLLAVPRSVTVPFVVLGRDRVAKKWNKEAEEMLGIDPKAPPAADDLFRREVMEGRDGGPEAVLEMIRSSFSVPETAAYEVIVKAEGGPKVCELLSFPVLHGPLAGGRVLQLREIRSESERIEKAVSSRLAVVKDCVHKISHGYPWSVSASTEESPAVKSALEDLENMKRKVDERELLWKSETGALLDQVSRQKEILERLQAEVAEIRTVHARALDLVSGIHGGDEHWHDEVCALERELVRWNAMRGSLEKKLARHESILETARVYEEEVRGAAQDLGRFLSGFDAGLGDLRTFSEEAKVHAVNMGFVKDPAYREFAARSRAYAGEVARFVENVERLSSKVKAFLSGHPGTSLAPHLEGEEADPALFTSLKEEEERLATYIQRWKESGEGLVAGGEEAVKLLRETEKKGAVLTQLGETSLLINEQAQGNLSRWN